MDGGHIQEYTTDGAAVRCPFSMLDSLPDTWQEPSSQLPPLKRALTQL